MKLRNQTPSTNNQKQKMLYKDKAGEFQNRKSKQNTASGVMAEGLVGEFTDSERQQQKYSIKHSSCRKKRISHTDNKQQRNSHE